MNAQSPWPGYDGEELVRVGAPPDAVEALVGRGLPGAADDMFVRVAGRELETAELPECGSAAFLAQAMDGFWNTYWLSLTDGSVWMRYGKQDEPVHHVRRVNTSVSALQAMLDVWCDYRDSDPRPGDGECEEYEDLVNDVIIRAVRADPEVFRDVESWWAITFEEVEYSLPRVLLGDRALYELVRQDESGAWVLDHPGYEDEG